MGTSRTRFSALWVFGAVFCAALGNSALTLASPVHHPATATVAAAAAPTAQPTLPKPAISRPALKDTSDRAAKKLASKPHQRELRRLRATEVTVAIAKEARKIINANYTKPFGTEIPFTIGGKHYVGRIERHYHPPGGKLHPWGYHHGCSVFVVVQ